MKNKQTLFMDTSGFDELSFALIDAETKKATAAKKVNIKYSQTEDTINFLNEFLKKAKTKPEDLNKIIVVSGPGSFTGLRVGFAHALAFSMVLGIDIYIVEKDKVPKKLADLANMKLKKLPPEFDPDYGRDPNITIKKPA